ncbi:hypothetical protein MXB_70, partial [Myxobolus squamalis]
MIQKNVILVEIINMHSLHQLLSSLMLMGQVPDNAMGHGVTVARVDGCDFYAVYIAVQNARDFCIENKLP